MLWDTTLHKYAPLYVQRVVMTLLTLYLVDESNSPLFPAASFWLLSQPLMMEVVRICACEIQLHDVKEPWPGDQS